MGGQWDGVSHPRLLSRFPWPLRIVLSSRSPGSPGYAQGLTGLHLCGLSAPESILPHLWASFSAFPDHLSLTPLTSKGLSGDSRAEPEYKGRRVVIRGPRLWGEERRGSCLLRCSLIKPSLQARAVDQLPLPKCRGPAANRRPCPSPLKCPHWSVQVTQGRRKAITCRESTKEVGFRKHNWIVKNINQRGCEKPGLLMWLRPGHRGGVWKDGRQCQGGTGEG